MADIYNGPYADYTLASSVVLVPATQTALIAMVDKFKALIPDPAASVSAATPDFDQIPPHTAEKLRAELTSMTTLIDAASTS